MLVMNQIDQIKKLQRQGYGPKEIAARLGIDRKTASRFILRDDYSPSTVERKQAPSKLDSWKPEIERWLEEDRRMRFKQRHSAKRVHHRLLQEHSNEYDCSYPLVQRYLKQRKAERKESLRFLELVWAAGEAQADFGEADLIEAGVRVNSTFRGLDKACRQSRFFLIPPPHGGG
jgi:transposase